MSTTGKSTAQTGNGFSLEFRGLENTYLSPSLSLSLTNLTAIFSVKQGKIYYWLVTDLTKYRGEVSVFFAKSNTSFVCEIKYEFRFDNR